jgi:hypothetical protein
MVIIGVSLILRLTKWSGFLQAQVAQHCRSQYVQPESAAEVVGSRAWYGTANAIGGAGSPGVRWRGAVRTCWLADWCPAPCSSKLNGRLHSGELPVRGRLQLCCISSSAFCAQEWEAQESLRFPGLSCRTMSTWDGLYSSRCMHQAACARWRNHLLFPVFSKKKVFPVLIYSLALKLSF